MSGTDVEFRAAELCAAPGLAIPGGRLVAAAALSRVAECGAVTG
jgi:hypothetical protein